MFPTASRLPTCLKEKINMLDKPSGMSDSAMGYEFNFHESIIAQIRYVNRKAYEQVLYIDWLM